ncbi:unnamed protein product, partial [Mesorhabditis spiculigera]
GWFPVVCGGAKKKEACTSTKFVSPCENEWLYSSTTKACYKRIGDYGGFKWPEARSRCQALGADLVSIHSADENRIVAELADHYSHALAPVIWYDVAGTWIGAERAGHGRMNFTWSDGTKFDYAIWAHGSRTEQPYVEMFTARFNFSQSQVDDALLYLNQWNDMQDYTLCSSAVCKKAAKFQGT